MRCIAINPQWYDQYFLSFPLGIATIVSIVRAKGHEVAVIDFDAVRVPDDEKASYLAGYASPPDIVMLTGMITNYARIRDLSALVKRVWPKCVTVLGGSLATTAPDSVLRGIEADIFVVGEGDETIENILEAMISKDPIEKVPGIKLKCGDSILYTGKAQAPDIKNVPRPCYEAFPMGAYINFYSKSGRSFEMYTSKGCPNACVYCYRVSGRKVRHRTVDDVIAEIEFVIKNYALDRFSFEDDNFAINKKWTLDFCDKVRPLGIKFRFQAFVNAFDDQVLDRLQEAGLSGVSVGMESGSPLVLKEMNKRISLERAEQLFMSLRRRGIKYNATFILGMPSESDETIAMTKEFLLRNGFTTNFQLFFVTPYPGTVLYRETLDQGKINDELAYIEKLQFQDSININITKYPDDKLTYWKEDIIKCVSAGASQTDRIDYSTATWRREAL